MRPQARSVALVLVFVLVTGVMIVATGATFARWRMESGIRYRALFTDASGLRAGVDVRASGVTVGNVDSVQLQDGHVLVTFTVPSSLPMTTSTDARIRWANLTGDRFMDLSPGRDRTASRLPGGATIPLPQTQPALDLDALFKGFNPLMQALDPEEVNQLTANLLAVTQGQAGAVDKMLSEVGSLTGHLAGRDRLIGSVIAHLTRALATIDDKHDQFDQLIVRLDGLVSGLARDRRTIGDTLAGLNRLALDTGGLLSRVRPDLKANIDQLGSMSRVLNQHVQTIEQVLDLYPSTIQRLGRGAAYGSFFNFYLCSVQVELVLPGQPTITGQELRSDVARCKFPQGG